MASPVRGAEWPDARRLPHASPGSGSGSEELDHTAEGVERYVERARERGVDEIGITEHVYYFRETRDFWALPYQLERSRVELGSYCDAVLEAKRRGLPVKLGLEVDWVPERADELAEGAGAVSLGLPDRLAHWIGGLAVDQKPGLWAGSSVEEVWALYARELEAAAGADTSTCLRTRTSSRSSVTVSNGTGSR